MNTAARLSSCLLLATASWFAAPAQAETFNTCAGFIDTLPATISSQGVWCLKKDLSTSMTSGNAISIATNNVTIDCNQFKIGGLGGGLATSAIGVSAHSKYNATIRNCNIRGFESGVDLNGGGGHLIENNSFDGNTYLGIYVVGGGSTIRGNSVVDTGLSTFNTHQVIGIFASDGVDIVDNTVSGVAPAGANGNALGIWTMGNGSASVSRNRVRGLSSTGTGEARGIYIVGSGRVIVRDNDLQGTAGAGSIGIRCHDGTGTARGNVVAGFATSVQGCLATENTYNTN